MDLIATSVGEFQSWGMGITVDPDMGSKLFGASDVAAALVDYISLRRTLISTLVGWITEKSPEMIAAKSY